MVTLFSLYDNSKELKLTRTHYTLSVAIALGHLFVPPCGLRQLCVPLAELVYHVNSDGKKILLYSLYRELTGSYRKTVHQKT